ncbi:MAG: hypothetical protein P4L84_30440 [Isosphaeraceae bacterium]|nr:hypothetical protein [Isosphaeraceae bacterium]
MRPHDKQAGSVRSGRRPATPQAEGPMRIEILIGSALCDLRVWTEEEWAALPEHERPLQFVHAPGLGWVGGVPTIRLN